MLIIVQPWFSTLGHPAQSLINTATVLKDIPNIKYLISVQADTDQLDSFKKKIRTLGDTFEFSVKTPSTREGTLKALWALFIIVIKKRVDITNIFFFDAHLVLLALFYPFFYLFIKPKKLSVINLVGPERILRSKLATWAVKKFLNRREVFLFLRTEELKISWRDCFNTVPTFKINYLPSLEITGEEFYTLPHEDRQIKFGVVGQIRHGKGLNWIIPLFLRNPSIGKLTVAGTFNNELDRANMKELLGFPNFYDKYLSEEELLSVAAEQDYLLVLYEDWDIRMESAVVYLAARVNRPVIAYDNGWCGRIIREFGNGIIVSSGITNFDQFLSNVPRPGTFAYNDLISGVNGFRNAHSGNAVRDAFLKYIKDDHVTG